MSAVSEILVSVFLVIGGAFGLVGSFGLLKLRDTMKRLHAPTKATTLGVGGVLIASMLYFLLIKNDLSFHELLITLFLFLTAPITANFISKTFMAKNLTADDVTGTGREYGWAIYDDPPAPDPKGEQRDS